MSVKDLTVLIYEADLMVVSTPKGSFILVRKRFYPLIFVAASVVVI